ncbi:hypothetical protein CcaverHIS631_0100260 [Cutaneotrichosporon cavernicola]|nr:hypothetical protein CcaverHIS631_0100260 [Cutaneotrichosporon cavernicola]BEJ02851.1 hypothetical protein CcaverHIS641_0100260 [Cutaneotrichosporon cavernicola]
MLLPQLQRRQIIVLLIAAISLILITFSHINQTLPDVPFLPKWDQSLPTVRAGRTVLYESAVHDEVTGALAHSLSQLNVTMTFATRFRFKFDQVLRDIIPYEPEIVYQKHPEQVREWLQKDEIDHLVLTTCTDGLNHFHDDILKSTATVVCVVHHGGASFARNLKDKLQALVERDQIRLVVLGHHVHQTIKDELQYWADTEDNEFWERVKLETFIPGFVYPPDKEFKHVAPFPHKAVIQANIEQGRRDYKKIFRSLNNSVHADPGLWGYKMGDNGVFEGDSEKPFELHLVGQLNPKSPVEIPESLRNIITIDEKLSYPDYYRLIADADILIPAFASRGTLYDTASSTIAAAIITRTPVLVSERHTASYTYIKGPAAIFRRVSEGAIPALERLRRNGDPRSPPDKLGLEWDEYESNIQRQNAEMWVRVLKDQNHRELWGNW